MILKDGEHRGGSRIFFRRGCIRLLLYFNTNKPQNTSCIRKLQVTSGGALDPPLEQISSLETFRFYYVVRARKPASFWRENVVTVVTLLRVLAKTSHQIVRSFITLRSGESVTSFAKVNSANFLVKNGNMKLSGESIFSECAKNVKSNLILVYLPTFSDI